jgi:hypothetical protein
MKKKSMKRLKDDLFKNIHKVEKSTNAIAETLDNLINYPGKSFDITYGKCKFFFHPATTKQEAKQQIKARKSIIRKLLYSAFHELVGSLFNEKKEILDPTNKIWNRIIPFALGADPKDFECQVIKAEDIYAIGDNKFGKSRPLDENAYCVKNERIIDVSTIEKVD